MDTNVNLRLAAQGSGDVVATAPVALPSYTVSSLPVCSSSVNKYAMAVVTDANSPTYNSTLTGSSGTIIPVFCNGSAWTAHSVKNASIRRQGTGNHIHRRNGRLRAERRGRLVPGVFSGLR